MPSPFPGMNPYLEQPVVWHDFHNTFLIAMRAVLAPQVESGYFVRVEEHVFIHEYDAEERRPFGRPDVSVHEDAQPVPTRTDPGGAGGVMTAPAAVMVPPAADEERAVYLEIRDRERRQVVTVIELLSPSNKKTGADRDVYWNKVRRVFATGCHLVEIDLLRGGPRMPWVGLPACDYYALVSRYEARPRADLWPVGIRDRLPVIPVPLRPDEPEPTVDLQAILDGVYDTARYGASIYNGLPEPRLRPDDAAWAHDLLAAGVTSIP